MQLTRKSLFRYIRWGVAIILIIGLAASIPNILETNEAGYLQVKQAAFTGEMTCRTEPGTYGQVFGDIFTYPEAETFFFTADMETGEAVDQSLPTRFNDGAQAQVSGSLRILMPKDCERLQLIHRKFHSKQGVMDKLVLPAVRKALFTAGPHMSSAESYAERRGEFAWLIEDQLVNGTILTEKKLETQEDPITGEPKEVWVVVKRECADPTNEDCIGGYLRDESAFHEFGISVTNFVVDEINYCPKGAGNCPVMQQIEAQRKARMDIITQQAEAKQAEARAAKADAEAKAKIAETRALEEVAKTEKIVRAEADKEQAVLQAEKKRDVAALDAEAAKLEKQANISRGEGEAERKKLVMAADGALEKKLDAWVRAQEAYANALATAKPGALVPYLQMGSTGGDGSSSGAADLIDLFSAKAARDLTLDMGIRGNTAE